jgi:SanA protein
LTYTEIMNFFKRLTSFFKYRFDLGKLIRYFFALLVVILIFVIVVPFNMIRVLDRYYQPKIYSTVASIPETRVAIVFGAGLIGNGNQPSPVLADRILTAIDLYKAGKIKKILMSGDNSFENYNEPQVMMNYAEANGVNPLDLQADFAGRRTYDTCYRAKYIFGIEQAVLITQDFHLNRALYTCNILGMDVIGYAADRNQYENISYFETRDLLATFLSYWELYVEPPQVILGNRITF